MHWTFEPNPDLKGSYRRRLEDIDLALNDLGIQSIPNASKFIGYYFGCEKLALGIIGIEKGVPAEDAYKPFSRVNLAQLALAARRIGVTFSASELPDIFAGPKDPTPPGGTSARLLRNDLVHDFGPTKVQKLEKVHAATFNPKMVRFPASVREVVAHLKRIWVP